MIVDSDSASQINVNIKNLLFCQFIIQNNSLCFILKLANGSL